MQQPGRSQCRTSSSSVSTVSVKDSYQPRLHFLTWALVCYAALTPAESQYCTCGLAATNRIYGGSAVSTSTYPWMGALLSVVGGTITQCGATLIAPQYAVTAGHCVPSNSSATSYMVFGANSFSSAASSRRKYNVDTFYVVSRGERGKDIAVIKLQRGVNRMPICLPPPGKTFSGARAKLLGYGQTESGRTSSQLLEGDVTIASSGQCARAQQYNQGEICGGNFGGQPSFCSGDSGGPMMSQNEYGEWELAGVISSTYGCNSKTTYGICTRVTDYLNVIQGVSNGAGCIS